MVCEPYSEVNAILRYDRQKYSYKSWRCLTKQTQKTVISGRPVQLEDWTWDQLLLIYCAIIDYISQ